MMWMCLMLLAVVHYGQAQTVTMVEGKPDCENHNCPNFTLISRNEDYDVRTYGIINWVRSKFVSYASPNSEKFWNDRREAVLRVLGYIRGENVDNQTVAADFPAFTIVCDNNGGPDSCNAEHSFDLHLPAGTPMPEPTNPLVDFRTGTGGTFFVRGWRGAWANRITDHKNNLKALRDALDRDGESYGENFHFYATYSVWSDNNYEEDALKKI